MNRIERDELADLHTRVVAAEIDFICSELAVPRDPWRCAEAQAIAKEATREFWQALFSVPLAEESDTARLPRRLRGAEG